MIADLRTLAVAAWLGAAGIGLCGGCEVHHHHDHDDAAVQIDIVDAHGWRHHGYYDERHDWHGGYYDEHQAFHDDPHDWHN